MQSELRWTKVMRKKLSPRLGGLGLKIFSQNAVEEYQNSTSVTVELQEQILETIIDEERKKRSQVKSERQRSQQTKLNILLSEMSQEDQRRTQVYGKKGASNWLDSLPMRNHGFDLSKRVSRCYTYTCAFRLTLRFACVAQDTTRTL